MTDREQKIAEIREALAKATPGPWYVSENGFSSKRSCPTVYATDEELRYIAFCDDSLFFTEPTPNLANAYLIANAPEWLGFLLDELERLEREYAEERAAHNAHVAELCELEKENRKLRKERDDAREQAQKYYRKFEDEVEETLRLQDELQSAQQEIERLKQERNKLIEVLRWYADTKNYEYRTSYLDQDAPIIDDNGQRARDILREVGVTTDA